MTAETRAERLYLDIYAVSAASADYLEPEDSADLFIAESVIAGLAATLATAFAQGVFKKLGERFAEKLSWKPWGKGKLARSEPEEVVGELARGLGTTELSDRAIADGGEEVRRAAQRLGLADDVCDRIVEQVETAARNHRRAE